MLFYRVYCKVLCESYTVLYTPYNIRRILRYTLYTVQCTVYIIRRTVYITNGSYSRNIDIHRGIASVRGIMSTIQYKYETRIPAVHTQLHNGISYGNGSIIA